MKVFTLGNGFVADHLSYPKILDRIEINQLQIKNMLETYKPDVLINTIGYTGHPNIDACELNKEQTFTTNTIIPILLAAECEKLGIRFIHIGSGCIFYSQSSNISHYNMTRVDLGWKETDAANAISTYSKSKYAADLAINSFNTSTILRIRMPLSNKRTSRNFINKILGYKQVIDIPNSVTFMTDLVKCVDWAIKKNKTGIWHVTNPEPLTAADVVREYQKYVPTHQFEVIDEEELDRITTAKRSNCIINSEKLKDAGFTMTNTKQALEQCMAEYIKTI